MTSKLVNRAKLLGWRAYQSPKGMWTLERSIEERKILLQEKESNKWLLISNQTPQLFLTTQKAMQFLEQVR